MQQHPDITRTGAHAILPGDAISFYGIIGSSRGLCVVISLRRIAKDSLLEARVEALIMTSHAQLMTQILTDTGEGYYWTREDV
jgi:hypothetical protein